MSVKVSFDIKDGWDAQMLIAIHHILCETRDPVSVVLNQLPSAIFFITDRLLDDFSSATKEWEEDEWRQLKLTVENLTALCERNASNL